MPLHPVTPQGQEGLAALLEAPGGALIALDYDGTLAPIVPRPEDAVPQRGAVEVLAALAPVVGQVALITGRPVDAVLRLGLGIVPGLVVLGQYGVQRWQAGELHEEHPAPGLDDVRDALSHWALEAGVEIEDKGLSLVVHARRSADPLAALTRMEPRLEELAHSCGLELHSGRLVLELRPPGSDKGRALASLLPGRSAVLFAGDDRGDLAAFDAVDAHRDAGGAGLLVCSDSDESPGELRERADLAVPGPPGVVALLSDLAAQL